MFSLLWLPQVLKDAGLNVQAVDKWETRGHGDFGTPLGVLAHHTCGPKDGDIRINHRSDLLNQQDGKFQWFNRLR